MPSAEAPQSLLLATTKASCVGPSHCSLVVQCADGHGPTRKHSYVGNPQEDSCSVVTHGVPNTSFSLCQCCLSAAQCWNRDCTTTHHTSFSTNPNKKRSALWEPSTSGAQRHPPWRPKPSVKSSLVPCLAQWLRLTPAKEKTFPSVLLHEACEHSVFQETRCTTSESQPLQHPSSRQFEAGRHQAERNCLATADDTSDMIPRPHDQPPAPSHWSEMN